MPHCRSYVFGYCDDMTAPGPTRRFVPLDALSLDDELSPEETAIRGSVRTMLLDKMQPHVAGDVRDLALGLRRPEKRVASPAHAKLAVRRLARRDSIFLWTNSAPWMSRG